LEKEADVFINQPFSGSEAHHIDKKLLFISPTGFILRYPIDISNLKLWL